MENIPLAPVQAEIITDARPSITLDVRVREVTQWVWADDASPVPRSNERYVKCCVAEQDTLDEYGTVVDTKPIILHKFYDDKQKRWNNDIAVSEIRAQGYMAKKTLNGTRPGLKDRFGTAISQYLILLAKQGRDIPIAFLADRVYPEVLNAFYANGVRTVQALATLDEEEQRKAETWFDRANLRGMSDRIGEFVSKAQAMLLDLGATERPKRKAA